MTLFLYIEPEFRLRKQASNTWLRPLYGFWAPHAQILFNAPYFVGAKHWREHT